MKFFKKYKSHYIALLYLGLPIVIGQIGVIIVGFADTLMVGHYSMEGLAAASFVNNVFNLAIIFGTGFAYGLTPIVGSLFGNKELPAAGRILKNSLFANVLVAILLTIVMTILYFNVEKIGQPKELIPLIKSYFIVLLISIIFIMLFNAFKQFADGITDTRTAMWILLGGNVIHIVSNYILIHGKLGMPELGLLGAGISTLFVRIIMLVAFVVIFFFTKRYALYRGGFSRSSINKFDFNKLNKIGWPVAFQMGMEAASFSLSAVMIGWLGAVALAAHQIMVTVSTVSFMMFYGMGAAIAVRVSNFKGRDDVLNIRNSAFAGAHIIILMAIITSSLIFLLRNYIGGWFTDEYEVNMVVITLVFPMLIYQFSDGMQIAFANALRGIADVKVMMIIAFISYFIVALPIGYICGFILGWGVPGVWMTFPTGLSCAAILMFWRFHKKTRNINIP
ncbi:MATE family efflux transporter [Dysgonomonas sp. Marseille-P4677]|uniref:MATE family efflux transporter n=1 Tax=Dysgonomonas sp. Marseille-P4677 TaxID=2364790 RepID=UPI0019132A87|nr:MATE family efflux transporter [Dysgonomonas sp. Marseille-P4677]MBK5720533.1 MATE family efflux transporter [Dysgonomonas sp. Marseille-P4677]